MSTTTTQTAPSETPTTEATAVTEQAPEMVPASRLNNMIEQIRELKAREAEYAKRDSELNAAKKADEERKAREAGEFEKLLKARDEEKNTLAQRLEQLERQNKIGAVERALLAAGVSDEIARDGMLTRYERENPEDVAAWIEAAKGKYSHIFSATPNPRSSGPVGAVPQGNQSSTSLKSRLASSDPRVKEAALKERFRLMAEGSYTERD